MTTHHGTQLHPVRLQAGMAAPGFALPDAAGKKVSLSEYLGKKVIVYFYPKAATPGCTAEACDFRDNLASLQSSGYEVLASPRTRLQPWRHSLTTSL